MGSIFHREPGSELPLCVGGHGPYLRDAAGRQYLDASGGAAVSILGHGDVRVVEAIRRQAETLAYAHTLFFTNAPSEELADMLRTDAPPELSRVYFLSGGSEANEAALKLARQYHVARGDDARTLVLHRQQSYHGATIATLSVSGNRGRRIPYERILIASPEVAPCYAYRHRAPGETPEAYGRRAADDLDRAIRAAGPERVSAFIMEPVVGATLGAVPSEPGYYRRVREICDSHGVLLIADEIMCGMGRTGTMFASVGEGVTPDLLTVAKGLAAGYQPIGALLVHQRIYQAICEGPGRFEHGHTYVGHPVGCAAALAVQQALRQGGLLARVEPLGRRLTAMLRETFGDHPNVGDIRGRGLLLGIELVADRATRMPFAPGLRIASRLRHAAMEEGLIIYPGQGTADGVAGDHVLIAPPYIWGDAEMEELAVKLGRTFERVLARCDVAA